MTISAQILDGPIIENTDLLQLPSAFKNLPAELENW